MSGARTGARGAQAPAWQGRFVSLQFGRNGGPAKYAGHSLRAGHATAAAIAGASERSVMNQTGHRSFRWCGGTSGMGACSGRTARGNWDYNSRAKTDVLCWTGSRPLIRRHRSDED
jgi:hypothetical protein